MRILQNSKLAAPVKAGVQKALLVKDYNHLAEQPGGTRQRFLPATTTTSAAATATSAATVIAAITWIRC